MIKASTSSEQGVIVIEGDGDGHGDADGVRDTRDRIQLLVKLIFIEQINSEATEQSKEEREKRMKTQMYSHWKLSD